MQVALRFIAGPSEGQLYELEPGDYVLGRQSTCDISAPDAGVSRQHSRIWSDGGDWFIEDLGSQNGTFVNGHRINQHRLIDDDVIWVSSHRIQVNLLRRSGEWIENVTVTAAAPPLYLAEETIDMGEAELFSDSLVSRKLGGLQALLEVATNTSDPNQMLQKIVAKLLDVFPEAYSVGVLVEDERTGELKVKCRKDRGRKYGQGMMVPATIIEHVVRDRRGVLLGEPDATIPRAPTPDPSGVVAPDPGPAGSRMGAPLQAQDANYGVLYVNCHTKAFSRDDVNLLTSIAAQAGLAIHSARMQQELLRRERFERDVRLARQIQRSLLPDAPPDIIGLDIAAHYEAAYQIGGDFYDFIWHDKEHLALVIGDVSGKAISAALYMARLTGELRSRTGIAQTPRRLLRQVNDALVDIGDDGMFATLIYAIYDFSSRSLVFSNAGHMPPLLRREGRVSVVHADNAHVPPIGIMPDMEVGEASIQLQRGDLLLLTTDGIHEAANAAGELYGERRLARCVRQARGSAKDVVEAILDDVAAHTGDALQRDDVTVVAVAVGDKRARRRATTDVDDALPTRGRAVTVG